MIINSDTNHCHRTVQHEHARLAVFALELTLTDPRVAVHTLRCVAQVLLRAHVAPLPRAHVAAAAPILDDGHAFVALQFRYGTLAWVVAQ